MSYKKSKILIVCDYPGWAYDNVSNAIIKELNRRYQIIKIYSKDLPIINHEDYDVIYCMWWRTDFLERNHVPRQKLCIQVASFWSWQNKFVTPLEELVRKYLNRAIAVSVNCPGLHELIAPFHPNVFLNPAGVDINKFPAYPPRSSKNEEKLVVGWTGSVVTHDENKGLVDIIIPACNSLNNVDLKIVTKEDHWIPHAQMHEFYRDIDVYLCASISEGTPNPVLESASCGRPVISTKVGIVPILIEEGINGFMVNRNISEIKRALIGLRDNRSLCASMGENNRKIIVNKGWNWNKRAMNYQKMFDFILGEH